MVTNQILPKTPLSFKVLSTSLRPDYRIRVRFLRKWIIIFLLSMTFLLTFPLSVGCDDQVPSTGTTYYVSPEGKNSNPGTLNAPWASPGYGSRKLKPGDTLVILSGRYILSRYNEDILIPTSGTTDAWITIRGKEGNRPALVGRDDLAMAIDLSGTSYVRIENLEITHDDQANGMARNFRDGIVVVEKPASHILFKNLYIHHLDEFGLNIQDIDNLRIIDCRIEYAGFGAVGGPQGEKGGWRNVLIQGCRLSYSGHYYQGGDGTNRPYDRPDGFGIESSSGPIDILQTVAEHNRGDGLDSKAENTTIQQTIVANNSCDGIKLWGDRSRIENTLIYGRGDGNPEGTPWSAIVIDTEKRNAHFEIINVTVDDTAGGNYLMYVQYDHQNLPISLHIQNSIFRGIGPESPIFIGKATKITLKNNLFYIPHTNSVLIHGDQEYTANTINRLGHGNIYSDPLFIQPAWGTNGNYHLKKGSPAINAGVSKGSPSIDLEGRSRDNAPDIGAYEDAS
ncbi:MAG TPA: hypothetical protein DCY53_02010 [Desulfobacteraceae bacterium]|nr:hypothetical protein [Desulfobacteraceae bacterium]